MALLALWALMQSLDPATFVPEVEQPVAITARGNDGAILAGLELVVTRDGAGPVRLGTTDASGRFVYVPREFGPHEVRAKVTGRRPDDPEIELVTVLDVLPARSRTRLAWWTVPLGMLLCWHGLRRWRRA